MSSSQLVRWWRRDGGGRELMVLALPLMDAAEHRQVLVDWNATAAPVPEPACVHELFAAQAARTPHAVAVAAGDATLTYGELDRRASQLARYLRGLGVGPEVPVALCLERSPEMVVAQARIGCGAGIS